jgi:hypothetical protein
MGAWFALPHGLFGAVLCRVSAAFRRMAMRCAKRHVKGLHFHAKPCNEAHPTFSEWQVVQWSNPYILASVQARAARSTADRRSRAGSIFSMSSVVW